jgi:hypothetical protein
MEGTTIWMVLDLEYAPIESIEVLLRCIRTVAVQFDIALESEVGGDL